MVGHITPILEASPVAESRFPDFFIVGAPKCGTTALYSYLRTHPDLYLSPNEKEPQYFCFDLFRDHPLYCRDWSDYVDLFERAKAWQLIGEASPYYLFSEVAIPRILVRNPNARFIAMVRSPVEMACSLHAELLRTREEDVGDLEAAWFLQEERSCGRHIPRTCTEPRLLQYRQLCSLGKQLSRFFALVPEFQRHVIVLDDLRDGPASVYRDTLSFLGLPDDGRVAFEPVNSHTRLRSRFLADLMLGARMRLGSTYRPMKRTLNRIGTRPFRFLWRLNGVKGTRAAIPHTLKVVLCTEFEEEIATMEKLLDRDFACWRNRVTSAPPCHVSAVG